MGRPSVGLRLYNGSWRATIDGERVYFGSDERKARAEYHRRMAAALREKPSGPAETRPPEYVSEAIDRWLTVNAKPCYEKWLRHFAKFTAELALDDVPRDLLYQFAAELRKATYRQGKAVKPISLKGIRHRVATAKAVLRYAASQDWLKRMPDVPKLAKPALVARDIPPARLAEILGTLPDKPGQILRFIAYTGCRPGEACGLRWADVRFDLGACVLASHKTAHHGQARTLYLTPQAENILRQLGPGEASDYVFTSRAGGPYKVNSLCESMRRRGFTTYQLRHSYAQRAVDSGVPLEVVAGLLGHADTTMTRTYAQVRSARLAEAAARIKLVS